MNDLIENVEEADVVVAALAACILQLHQFLNSKVPEDPNSSIIDLAVRRSTAADSMVAARRVMDRVQHGIRNGRWRQ